MSNTMREIGAWIIGIIVAVGIIGFITKDYLDTRTKANVSFDNAVNLNPLHQSLTAQFNKIQEAKKVAQAAATPPTATDRGGNPLHEHPEE